ncbi:MAG: hypothetical protein WC188_04675 [Candidatus Caldatribacteriota bacterium]|nr:hypothetical protein [Patescibacteria group bacterium]
MSDNIYVSAKFNETVAEIGYTFLGTGEQNIVKMSNGRINMLHGRMYYVPIDNDETIDSDNYNIKIPAEIAENFDIRFIKDSFAAIVPIKHNAILRNGERICILTPLN